MSGVSVSEPRWRRMPEERPTQILDAALEVFGEHGLEGARMEDIAEGAGVSKATIYLYFPSKVDLFRAMVGRSIGDLREEVADMEVRESPAEALELFARTYWDHLLSTRFVATYRLVLANLDAFPDLVREYARDLRIAMFEVASPLLERGVEVGEFRPGDPAVRARMLLAILVKHALWCARRELVPDLQGRSDDEILEEVMTFFFEALGRPRPDGGGRP